MVEPCGHSSIAPPTCRRCWRNVYEESSTRRSRYSSNEVCARNVSPAAILKACSRSARIVDDEDIARPRRTECLEEDVDAAVMAGRECAPGDPCTGSNGCNPRRRHAQRHASPQTTVGDKGRRKLAKGHR